MTDKKINIQDLSEGQRRSVGEHYQREFAGFLNILQHTLAQTVLKRDALAFCFLCDIMICLIKSTAKYLDLDDSEQERIKTNFTWTTPTIGKC